jgi:hypothetical protein
VRAVVCFLGIANFSAGALLYYLGDKDGAALGVFGAIVMGVALARTLDD